MLKRVAIVFCLACIGASGALADSRQEIRAAHEATTEAARNVKTNIEGALALIQEITAENAEQKSNEVLATIDNIEGEALGVLDQLALNGPFMNALDHARVEIRKTIRTVAAMPEGVNRNRNLAILHEQAERFEGLQSDIRAKEGEITSLIARFSTLRRDIRTNIRVGLIGDLISNLETVRDNLTAMTSTLNLVLDFDVADVTQAAPIITE